jgi:oligosaccharide repeat unit polymerase
MKINKKSFINPLFLSILIWVINLLGHLLFPNIFGTVTNFTVGIVFLYLFFFAVGYFLGHFPKVETRTIENLVPRLISKYLILIFLFVLVILFYNTLSEISPESLVVYRSLVNSSFTEKNDLFWLLRLFSIVFFFANVMYFISSGRIRLLWGFVAITTSILGSGRNFLLIFLLTALGVSIRESKNNIFKIFVVSFISLVSLFGFFIVAFDKTDSNNSIIHSIFISFSGYFLNPLHGFSSVTVNVKNWGSSFLLSEGVLNFLGINYSPVPPMPYTDPPAVTNVYTLFWPMYHDLGVFGIIFFGLLYGFIHNYFYRGFKSGNIYLSYFYLLSLYPLIMSIFHDVYISSLGLWVGAILPLIFLKRIRKPLIYSVS